MCKVCHKVFPSAATMQLHLRTCINTGWKPKVMVQRLTEEQVLVYTNKLELKDPELYECQLCGACLKSAGFLKSHVNLHLTKIPGKVKCAVRMCKQTFVSSEILKEHRKEHYNQILCDECGRIFCSDRVLLVCAVKGCSYSGKTNVNLRNHMSCLHSIRLFQCCHVATAGQFSKTKLTCNKRSSLLAFVNNTLAEAAANRRFPRRSI